jgi:hypothetical protein
MILVIPFPGPSEYLDELSARLLKLGGLGGHRLLVPAPSDQLAGAEAFVSGLRSQFVAADLVPVKTPGVAMVRLFRDGTLAAASVKSSMQEIPNAPVLWLEPGYLPVKEDWADKLQSAFFNSGGGVKILAAWSKRPDATVGNGNARHVIPGGWEPVGPAVFPSPFINSCEMIHRINDASAPWRERLQLILGNHMADSPLLSETSESLLTQEVAKPKAAPKIKEVVAESSDVVASPEVLAPPTVRRTATRTLTPAEA